MGHLGKQVMLLAPKESLEACPAREWATQSQFSLGNAWPYRSTSSNTRGPWGSGHPGLRIEVC